jgi:hypothetical protein
MACRDSQNKNVTVFFEVVIFLKTGIGIGADNPFFNFSMWLISPASNKNNLKGG